MKEDFFDVLIYLFENYMDNEHFDEYINSDSLMKELEEAGFNQNEISKAFDWLESLSVQRLINAKFSPNFRIFCKQEQAKLDLECQNFLMFLEHSGILNSAHRELVIDRAMALDEEISLEKLKWITLLVLLSLPNEEIAFARMEDIIYDQASNYIH